MNPNRHFRWPFEALLEEAREALDLREQAVREGQDLRDRSLAERDARLAELEAAAIAERSSIADIDRAMLGRSDLVTCRRAEHRARQAVQAVLQARLDLDTAGDRVREAERSLAVRERERDDSQLAVREFERMRERAHAAHRRELERFEERRREDDPQRPPAA